MSSTTYGTVHAKVDSKGMSDLPVDVDGLLHYVKKLEETIKSKEETIKSNHVYQKFCEDINNESKIENKKLKEENEELFNAWLYYWSNSTQGKEHSIPMSDQENGKYQNILDNQIDEDEDDENTMNYFIEKHGITAEEFKHLMKTTDCNY